MLIRSMCFADTLRKCMRLHGIPQGLVHRTLTSFDHTARIWHGDTGACLRIIDGHEMSVYAICFSPCARYLATGGIDHRVLITRILVRKWVNYNASHRCL